MPQMCDDMTKTEETHKIQRKQHKPIGKWGRAVWCALSVAAVVLWGRLIFGFSAQTATTSSGLSERVCYVIADEINRIRQEGLSETQLQERAEKIQYPIRKCAHMTEYAIFALLLFNMLCTFGVKGKRRFAFALLLVFLYAATDEFHQLYVPGRSGQFTDVLIDTAGGLVMLLLLAAVCRIRARRA
jgi:VanZ family protein